MTKKDFKLIAAVVAGMPPDADMVSVAYAFANALASTNPRFDRERFLKAATGKE